MTDVEPVVTDFASTARTGRRNAIPDLLGAAAGPSGSAEMSNKLAELTVVGADMLLCLFSPYSRTYYTYRVSFQKASCSKCSFIAIF